MRAKAFSMLAGTIKPFVTRLRVFFRREPWVAEMASAVAILLWAALSSLGFSDIGGVRSMPALIGLAGPWFWHAAALALGVGQIVVLLLDQRWLRWVVAMLIGWLWGSLSAGFWLATPWAAAAAPFAGFCGANAFSVVRIFMHRE